MKFTLSTLLLIAASASSVSAATLQRRMSCSGGLDYPCQDLCFCSGGEVSCHYDPTSRCVQMCNCGAASPSSLAS